MGGTERSCRGKTLPLIFTTAPTGQHTLPAPVMPSIIMFSPNGLSGITLNELTLASQFAPLPLTWLSFTAKAQNNSQSLLQWPQHRSRTQKIFTYSTVQTG
jgi:hypothetical protein